jgi:hypothetical protein
MAFTLSTGATVNIAKTYSAAIAMSAVTNATEAVATLAASHGVTAGTYLELTSGWGKIDKMVVRVKSVATNDVVLEGLNTSEQMYFTPGSGIGSVRRITAWTQLTQIKDISSSGGEQSFAEATTLDSLVERKIPTMRSAVTMNMTVYDDPALAWYADVTKASDSSTPYALRMDLPGGSKMLANAYWSLQKVPMIARNEVLGTQMTLTYAADPIRYAS